MPDVCKTLKINVRKTLKINFSGNEITSLSNYSISIKLAMFKCTNYNIPKID